MYTCLTGSFAVGISLVETHGIDGWRGKSQCILTLMSCFFGFGRDNPPPLWHEPVLPALRGEGGSLLLNGILVVAPGKVPAIYRLFRRSLPGVPAWLPEQGALYWLALLLISSAK